MINGRETKADLLFYTEHPDVWHSTLRTDNKHFKMCGNKTMRQLYIDGSPKFNINIYKTGTIMIQGSETNLEKFEIGRAHV